MNFKNNMTFEPTPGASIRYLQSLGIVNVDSFLYKPRPSDYESPWNLDKIEELIDELYTGFTLNKNFFLQVDSDTDGYTSSSIFYNYFKTLFPEAKIEWRIHDGKEHGVIVKTVPCYTDIVIIPDAGSNQIDEIEELTRAGRKVLIMDHHVVNHISNYDGSVIVNNQTSANFHNKSLSGAGVVLKVIQAYDEKYNGGKGLYKKFEDLAAVGIIADCMDTRNLDNNAIIRNGLANINNEMVKALMLQQSYKIGGNKVPNKIDVAFYIAPLINAVIRSGTLEEKEEFFKGFITAGCEETIVSYWRGEKREESYYQYLARTAYNLRNRQNSQKEKSIEAICEIIEENNLHHNKVLILKINADDVPQNITGLVAMEIQKRYNRPTLVLRPVLDNGYIYYRGSGRASVVENFDNFMEVLQKSNLMDYVEGHDNAFGASVLEDNIPALLKFLNEELKDVTFQEYCEVDCSMNDKNWNNVVLKEFGEMIDVFGYGIPQPKFHFNFQVKTTDFRVQGARGDSLKIQYKGVVFIAFLNKDLVNKYMDLNEKCLKSHKEIKVELIGRSQINDYNGFKNVNIMIDNIELTLAEPKVKALF